MNNIQIDDSMIVIVHPIADLDKLEEEWDKYQSLPIQLMQHSDDAAIKIYGMTNRTIYEKMKAYLLSGFDDYSYTVDSSSNSIVDEEFSAVDTDDSNELLDKIELAKSLNTNTMVVFYPPTVEYPYTMEDLQDAYERYNNLPQDLKRLSDQECHRLFGDNNLNMYHRCKNALIDLVDNMPDIFDHDAIQEADTSFNNYFRSLDRVSGIDNLLEKKIELLVLKNEGSLLESTFAEDSITRIDDSINKERELSDCVPEFVPSLIPTEIEDIMGLELTEIDKKFLSSLKTEIATGFKNFDSKGYFKELNELDQSNNQAYTISMIRKGWNPSIPLTNEGFEFARNRMRKYIQEYYKINLVDMRNKDITLEEEMTHNVEFTFKPVFLISGIDDCYISLDTELSWLYNDEKDPISINIVDDQATINVFCAFVDNSTFIELKKHINDARYNMEIFNSLRASISDKKRLCSVFVDAIATMTNMNRINDPVVYYVFRGEKYKYTADFVIPILNAILVDTSGVLMRKVTPSEALKKIMDNHSIANYKAIRCNESQNEEYETIRELQFLYTANSVVSEAKSIPIRLNSKGVVIDLPTRIEEEYQTIHKALTVYEKEKNYDAMKDSLAHLWYLNLLCERKINKIKDNEKKEDKLKVNRDTRARILNDFKKYLKLVISSDKEFDFASYFSKSKYNDRSVFINTDTLRYTGKAVSTIIKSLISKQH